MKASSQIINSATNINCPYLLLGLMGFSTNEDRNAKNAEYSTSTNYLKKLLQNSQAYIESSK